MTVRRIAGVVAVISLMVVGCGESTPVESADEIAVVGDGPVVLGRGSPIAIGFTVPKATLLLMPPLPQAGGEGESPGWTAYLRPRDPVATFNDLTTQAQKLGFELGVSSPDPCFADPDEQTLGNHERPASFEAFPDGVESIAVECKTLAYREVDGVEEEVFIFTSQDFRQTPPISRAEISLTRIPAGSDPRRVGTGRFDLSPLAQTNVRAPKRDIEMAPPALRPGDPLSSLDGESGFTLLEGSRLVAPVNESGGQGCLWAALDVTGKPEKVFEGYVDRLREMSLEYGSPPTLAKSALFERRIEQASTNTDDSTMVTLTLVVGTPDEPVRLMIERCKG
ncbi:MAG TPA: hypothetical protein VL068_13905 [Microthrixaceae bacterium]|nr:hypothetical protein [Microthrixaceae bacterium]